MPGTLIMGGTSGFGKALAKESLQRGSRTVILGRNLDNPLTGAEYAQVDLSRHNGLAAAFRTSWLDIDTFIWSAGSFLRKPLTEVTPDEMARLTAIHLIGFAGAIAAIHRLMSAASPLGEPPGRPYHLVVIGSTGSWRTCRHESVYGAMKAAQAHLVRTFHQEMAESLPQAKMTLFNLSGIKAADACLERGLLPQACMTRERLAQIVWFQIENQSSSFREINILRDRQWKPVWAPGARTPETPE